MKCLLYLIISYLPWISYSQVLAVNNQQINSNSGIKWSDNLTWEQVKEKAKKENKYIFLDVFATWCSPCKLMDKEVYPNDTVGSYFNQRFISVKVQTDQTKKDNDHVKRWYNDAEAIGKQYRVEGYPCFIFLNPQGNIVHKEEAYKSVTELITMARIALSPGKIYDDPYTEFDRLVAEYKKGNKNLGRMPYMISTSLKLGETDLAKQILKEYTDYCLTLTPDRRYTKENIEVWASISLTSKMRIFQFFYKDGAKIDRVMNKKGYAKEVIDNIIKQEIVGPFMIEQSGGNRNMVGMVLSGPGVKVDYSEADWKKLRNMIRQKYNADYAKRNVIDARIEWYLRNKNWYSLAKYQLFRYKKYTPDFTVNLVCGMTNSMAWHIFLYSTDQKQIRQAINWQEKAIQQYPVWPMALDTYANLLYKAGRKQEAIHWQEKAANQLSSLSEREKYMKIADQMKRNEPTYIDRGAIWK